MCLVVYLSGDDNVDNVSGCISSISFDVRLFVTVKQHSYCLKRAIGEDERRKTDDITSPISVGEDSI